MSKENDTNKWKEEMNEENERRVDQLVDLVDKHTRTERHLEQYEDISTPERIKHAKELQDIREKEIDNLKNIIVTGEHSNNDELKNLKKRYKYTEGYIDHNEDRMDSNTLEMTKEKQEHRKEQMNWLSDNDSIN
jgi:beta-lactamase superfamily II metal-dependent hydrolase